MNPVFPVPAAARSAPPAALPAAEPAAAPERLWQGVWVPLVTPLRHQQLDLPALDRLCRHLGAQGIAGFVACGSTGEAAALRAEEQLAVLDTVLAAAQGLPVVMGLGGDNLAHAEAWARQLRSRPLAGLLVAPPAYVRPAPAGSLHWFRAIADASDAPLIVYDIPYRTGAVLPLEMLLTLAQDPRFQAIKDCGGDAAKTQALIDDGRLRVLAGEDHQIFQTLALGGHGAIAASAHLHTHLLVRLVELLQASRLPEARLLWRQLRPWIQLAFAEPNPAPVKAALALQGWLEDGLRWPMTAASPALVEALRPQALPASPATAG